LSLLLACLFITGTVHAHEDNCKGCKNKECGHGKDHHCLMAQYKAKTGGFLLNYKSELSLSDEQCKELEQIYQAHRSRMKNRKKEIYHEKELLNKMLESTHLNVDKIQAQIILISELETAFIIDSLGEFNNARKVLTEKQLAKLHELLTIKR